MAEPRQPVPDAFAHTPGGDDPDRLVLLNPMPDADFDRFIQALEGEPSIAQLAAMSEELANSPSYVETGVLLRIIGERLVAGNPERQ